MSITPIEPAARENLIRLADAWCKATGNRHITASRYAHSDPSFFNDLITRHRKWIKDGKPLRVEKDRKGSFTFRVYDKVLAWFKANWPADAEFPQIIDLFHQPKEDHQHGTTEGIEEQSTREAPEASDQEGRPAQSGSTAEVLARLRGGAG